MAPKRDRMDGPEPGGEDVSRRILHVDMDAFFASVEQRDNPDLRGRPVAVGRGQARGVVAAASYEARRYGVKSAMPSVTAARACPDLVFVPPRFEVYRAVSAEIHAIFRRHTGIIEPLSLDEAYLDVTEACRAGRWARDIAEEIRAAIRAETGLTASAGVSYNKFLAKLASDQMKPDGMTVIRPDQGAAFAASLPVGRFHGVGPVTEERMRAIGIVTGADLATADMGLLERSFGNSAAHFRTIARGIDPRPVQPHRERKSVGAEETFATDLGALAPAMAELDPIAEKVALRAAEKGVAGRTVTLKVKFSDFEQITRRRTLEHPLSEAIPVARQAGDLLAGIFPFRAPIRLLGISLSSLLRIEDVPPEQPGLFDL